VCVRAYIYTYKEARGRDMIELNEFSEFNFHYLMVL